MRQPWLRRVGMYLAPCVLTALLNAPAANAQVPIRVRMQGHTNPVQIGTLTWEVRNPTGRNEFMRAEFTFVGGWGPLLDPIYDFRWFNVVNEDTDPGRPPWFNPDTQQWEQPATPYADPPAGGWDYNGDGDANDGWNTGSQEAADNSPFYDDDDTFGGFWRFGRWHQETQWSRFEDDPSTGAGHHVLFKTFLVAVLNGENTIRRGQHEFVKLAGFSWRLDGADDITKLGQIDPAREKQKIAQALSHSGFGNWGTIQLNEFTFVPEPASLLVLGVGLAGLRWRCRRRAA